MYTYLYMYRQSFIWAVVPSTLKKKNEQKNHKKQTKKHKNKHKKKTKTKTLALILSGWLKKMLGSAQSCAYYGVYLNKM